jgi:hypothetical protein
MERGKIVGGFVGLGKKMKREQLIMAVLLLSAVMIAFGHGRWFGNGPSGDSGGGSSTTVEYQGHSIKLTRLYATFEDYKDDPNNIDPSEYGLVKQLVTEAPVAASYPDIHALTHDEVFNLTFPGYGCGWTGDKPPPEGLLVTSIEIPMAESERMLVFRKQESGYLLIDDFVANDVPGIRLIREKGGSLNYYSRDGERVASHAEKVPR